MATPETESSIRGGLPLFKIAGIQIRLDLSWFIIFAMVGISLSAGYFPQRFPDQQPLSYWLAGLLATLCFFGSILVHELAHSLMARRAGIQVPEITLFIFGGMSRLSEEAKDAKTEFKIAIVGPFASFALALMFWAILRGLQSGPPSLAVEVLTYLAWINLAVGIFNLIPAFPLDGGRVLRAFLWHRSGSLTQATRTSANIGKGFAIVLMVFGGLQIFTGALIGGLWLIFIGMFLRGMAAGGYEEVAIRQSLAGMSVQEVMIDEVVRVPPDLPLEHLVHHYFLRYGYRGFPVVHDNKVLGFISLAHMRDLADEQRRGLTVEDVMQPLENRMIVTPKTSLADALKRMTQEELNQLLVMQDVALLGMITKAGVLRFLEIKQVLKD
jgi:Zn-dependent protease/predicted transcriptional regulator